MKEETVLTGMGLVDIGEPFCPDCKEIMKKPYVKSMTNHKCKNDTTR